MYDMLRTVPKLKSYTSSTQPVYSCPLQELFNDVGKRGKYSGIRPRTSFHKSFQGTNFHIYSLTELLLNVWYQITKIPQLQCGYHFSLHRENWIKILYKLFAYVFIHTVCKVICTLYNSNIADIVQTVCICM